MTPGPLRGLLRAAVALALAVALAALGVVAHVWLKDLLHWFDFLSPVPGLSGLALLALFPVLVLALFFGVTWVVAGFTGETDSGSRVDTRDSG